MCVLLSPVFIPMSPCGRFSTGMYKSLENDTKRLQNDLSACQARLNDSSVSVSPSSPEMLTYFILYFFNMKSLSNMIPFTFVLKINFNRDFILKTMQKKIPHISVETLSLFVFSSSVCVCSLNRVFLFFLFGGGSSCSLLWSLLLVFGVNYGLGVVEF